MHDSAVIGHITLDRIIGKEGVRTQLGGPPAYISLAFQKLSKKVRVISKVGEDIPERFVLQLRDVGVEIEGFKVKGSYTTGFTLDYREADRLLSVQRICDEITPVDLEELPEVVLISLRV